MQRRTALLFVACALLLVARPTEAGIFDSIAEGLGSAVSAVGGAVTGAASEQTRWCSRAGKSSRTRAEHMPLGVVHVLGHPASGSQGCKRSFSVLPPPGAGGASRPQNMTTFPCSSPVQTLSPTPPPMPGTRSLAGLRTHGARCAGPMRHGCSTFRTHLHGTSTTLAAHLILPRRPRASSSTRTSGRSARCAWLLAQRMAPPLPFPAADMHPSPLLLIMSAKSAALTPVHSHAGGGHCRH